MYNLLCEWGDRFCKENPITNNLRGKDIISFPWQRGLGEIFNKSLSNKLQKLQNQAALILTFSSYDTSVGPLFEQLNWKWLDTQ